MKKMMSNREVYETTVKLQKFFGENNELFLPVVINYAIQRNLNILMPICKAIEKSRNTIGEKYGIFNPEDNSYHIEPDNILMAEKEMENLMDLEEKIEIRMITLEDLSELKLSSAQMAALLFMIEEE